MITYLLFGLIVLLGLLAVGVRRRNGRLLWAASGAVLLLLAFGLWVLFGLVPAM